ncbi:MAG: peptidase S8 [Planctomycetota bacterium]|nr:MAG: peptidase S8 [Planctomycetota bacterium]
MVAANWSAPGTREPLYAVSLDGGGRFSRPQPYDARILLRYAEFDPLREAEPAVDEGLQARAEHELWIVQYVVKGLEPWRQEIQSLGARHQRVLANHGDIWRMGAATAAEVATLPFVRWVGRFHPAYKLEDELLAQLRGGTLQTRGYRVEVGEWGAPDKALVAARIQVLGGQVDRFIEEGYVLEATLTPAQLLEVLHWSEVQGIDRVGAPEPDMNNVRAVFGANYLETVAGFTGTGVRAEVMDGGLDTNHPDWTLPPILHGTVPSDAHGTCTFGINFGNGSSAASARGMVPSAQGIIASYSFLSNRYTHTQQLVTTYQAVYQSNSWGDPWTTAYTSISQEMDDIIYLNDIIITQSQSNTGNQQSRPQAWAKNIVSVGGIHHFNNQNDGDDRWNGSASIGPAADGRIKPDLAGYYDNIWTSDEDPGGYVTGDDYTGFCCTSAATPQVAGSFGLFFEMWHNGLFGNTPGASVFASRPHASLAKAMLINSARSWSFTGTTSDLTRTHQGWGKPDLQKLYDNAAQTFWVNETDLLQDLQSKSYTVTVPAGAPEFRATLVYTDRAGTTSSSQHRINDLSLKVTTPGGTVYWGNNGLNAGNWSTAGGASNIKDTVENVFVQNPAAGDWTVEVFADDVNQDTHAEDGTSPPNVDYALVVVPDTGGGCGTVDTIALSGPNVAFVGSTVTLDYSGAPGSAPFFMLYSFRTDGSVINGQCFDIGPTVFTAGTGTTAALGFGSWTSSNIPARAAGRIVHVEMRVDSGGDTFDSNYLTISVF